MMPSLLMRYSPVATDAGLTARDQLIALSRVDGLALAFEPRNGPLNNVTLQHRILDRVEATLLSTQVDSIAPEMVIWDGRTLWDQGQRRRILLIPDAS